MESIRKDKGIYVRYMGRLASALLTDSSYHSSIQEKVILNIKITAPA